MLRESFFLVGLLVAAGNPASSSKLVGYWYGDNYQTSGHGYYQEFDSINADGTFKIEFRQYQNCKLVYRQVEGGSWSLSDEIVHMVTNTINGEPVDPNRDPSLIDDYQILLLDNHDYQDKHVSDGAIFKVWRVGEHFEFPKCDFTS